MSANGGGIGSGCGATRPSPLRIAVLSISPSFCIARSPPITRDKPPVATPSLAEKLRHFVFKTTRFHPNP
jgi:hypothetical protein